MEWTPRPHWVATDQLVPVDTEWRAIRHLATVINAEKVRAVESSLQMLLDLGTSGFKPSR